MQVLDHEQDRPRAGDLKQQSTGISADSIRSLFRTEVLPLRVTHGQIHQHLQGRQDRIRVE